MISDFCIKRPVATILMSLGLIISGILAYGFLPVAALPRVDFPVISVTAQLPGASPDTMANSVATPLIKQFATIAGIDTMSASSTLGATSITLEFDLNRNIDAAALDVQSAIARAQRQLPDDLTTPPSYRKVNPADAPILNLALRSDTIPLSQLDEYAESVISPALSTLPGVAQVNIYGSQKFAVRIQIDTEALIARGIGVDEVMTAVQAANANTPVGTLDSKAQSLTLEAHTTMADAQEFGKLIIGTRNGRPVRLSDVAKVVDSVENDKQASWYDGSPAIVLAVQRQPDANTVAVVDAVKAMLPQFKAELPPSVRLDVSNDRSVSIRTAVDDVQFTLALTIGLVLLVIFVFLRRLSATLIPSLAVPISLIATIAGMAMMGFSIDNISLLGLTLSVGLVVDDAIVMLENIVRHIEEGAKPFEAALKGAREIGFTIISITLSLVAVFLPVLLMGGVVGRVFNEFAMVVTMSLAASAFVSLTLTPMMCARLLSHHQVPHGAKEGGLGGLLERGFDALLRSYDCALRFCLRYKPVMLLVFAGTIAGTAYLFVTIPKGFFPQEDIGQLQVRTEARQDISFPLMAEAQAKVAAVFAKSPAVEHVTSIVGGSTYSATSLNQGRMFIQLKDKEQRGDLSKVLTDLRRELVKIPGIDTYMVPVQNLNIGGRQSKSAYQFVMQGLDTQTLYDWATRIGDAMAKAPDRFLDVSSDMQNNAIQASLIIDRDKADTLGISASQLRSTLYSGFGTRQVSTIYETGDSYQVILEFDPDRPWNDEALDRINVRAANGRLIPIGAFAHIERTVGPLSVNQLGQLPAVTISFNLPPGVSLGDAIARIDEITAAKGMPATISTSFAGTAKTFQAALANQGLLLAAAVMTIYIVLGILYESFIHPLTILSGLPSAVLGALLALRLFDMDLSVIAIIGLLMLIGIVKKNAIMMIDVAIALRRDGVPAATAIHQACLLRFRPIMMTTLAALMGTLPIALGEGASAELRQPLGIVVVGGLLVSQVITLLLTPVLYLYMEQISGAVLGLFGHREPHPVEGAAPAE